MELSFLFSVAAVLCLVPVYRSYYRVVSVLIVQEKTLCVVQSQVRGTENTEYLSQIVRSASGLQILYKAL